MKIILSSILSLLLVINLASCSGPKKAAEPQVATAPVESKVVEQPVKEDGSQANMGLTQGKAQHNESITGKELIAGYTARLVKKLELTGDQSTTVENVMTKTFIDSGEKLENVYDLAQAKIIGKNSVVKSSDAIMAILNENQKAMFTKFLQQ